MEENKIWESLKRWIWEDIYSLKKLLLGTDDVELIKKYNERIKASKNILAKMSELELFEATNVLFEIGNSDIPIDDLIKYVKIIGRNTHTYGGGIGNALIRLYKTFKNKDIEQLLSTYGIKVKSEDGSIKPFAEIIEEISEIWKELDDEQQLDLATKISHQINFLKIFDSIVEDKKG
jgi:hypothetical protein